MHSFAFSVFVFLSMNICAAFGWKHAWISIHSVHESKHAIFSCAAFLLLYCTKQRCSPLINKDRCNLTVKTQWCFELNANGSTLTCSHWHCHCLILKVRILSFAIMHYKNLKVWHDDGMGWKHGINSDLHPAGERLSYSAADYSHSWSVWMSCTRHCITHVHSLRGQTGHHLWE